MILFRIKAFLFLRNTGGCKSCCSDRRKYNGLKEQLLEAVNLRWDFSFFVACGYFSISNLPPT